MFKYGSTPFHVILIDYLMIDPSYHLGMMLISYALILASEYKLQLAVLEQHSTALGIRSGSLVHLWLSAHSC